MVCKACDKVLTHKELKDDECFNNALCFECLNWQDILIEDANEYEKEIEKKSKK